MKGYIALSMIILISAVVIGVSTTVALLSIGEAQTGLTAQNGEITWNLIDGCAEDALQKIHDNSVYSGGTITRPEGTCTVSIISGNPNWDITVTSNGTKYVRKVEIKVTRTSKLTITSWLEI